MVGTTGTMTVVETGNNIYINICINLHPLYFIQFAIFVMKWKPKYEHNSYLILESYKRRDHPHEDDSPVFGKEVQQN